MGDDINIQAELLRFAVEKIPKKNGSKDCASSNPVSASVDQFFSAVRSIAELPLKALTIASEAIVSNSSSEMEALGLEDCKNSDWETRLLQLSQEGPDCCEGSPLRQILSKAPWLEELTQVVCHANKEIEEFFLKLDRMQEFEDLHSYPECVSTFHERLGSAKQGLALSLQNAGCRVLKDMQRMVSVFFKKQQPDTMELLVILDSWMASYSDCVSPAFGYLLMSYVHLAVGKKG